PPGSATAGIRSAPTRSSGSTRWRASATASSGCTGIAARPGATRRRSRWPIASPSAGRRSRSAPTTATAGCSPGIMRRSARVQGPRRRGGRFQLRRRHRRRGHRQHAALPRGCAEQGVREQHVLKLGYKASAEQFGPSALLEFSCLAEEVGFDSIFVSDHFQPWKHTDGHAPSALAWLGALGARTRRAVIGTSVLTPTFRYHPSIVAQVFGTLGAMFPGRVVLGVGTGESLNEVPASGVAWPGAKERRDRLREAIALINKLWSEDRVTFQGQFYRTESATIYDKPKDKVPIWVAASGPLAAAMAGQVAEGFICTSGKNPQLYTELTGKVAEGLARAGRREDGIEKMIEVKVSFDTDAQQAKELTRHWAALALSPEEKVGIEDPVEMERLADALPLDRAASRWIVSSDPEEQVARIRPYVELGFRHLVFHAPGPDQARFLKLYAERVLPLLRKEFG